MRVDVAFETHRGRVLLLPEPRLALLLQGVDLDAV
jgi:hypothetical protein